MCAPTLILPRQLFEFECVYLWCTQNLRKHMPRHTVCNPYAQNSHGEIVNSNKMMKKPNKKPCFEVNTMHFTFTWITNQFKGNFGAVAFTFYALHSHCIGERRHNVCRWVFQKKTFDHTMCTTLLNVFTVMATTDVECWENKMTKITEPDQNG